MDLVGHLQVNLLTQKTFPPVAFFFTALGAIEGQMTILKKRYDKLSEQEVIECARNPYDRSFLGCNGGSVV